VPVEHAAIEQDVAEIFLHPDLAQNLQRLIEIGQSGIGLADGDLIRRQFREVGRQQALHTHFAGDFHRILDALDGFIRLIHQTIGNAESLQNQRLLLGLSAWTAKLSPLLSGSRAASKFSCWYSKFPFARGP